MKRVFPFNSTWMSCNKGIFRASKQELNDFADQKISSISTLSYGVAEGMITAECNGGSMPSACKMHDGRLVFPTVKGFVIVDPKTIQSNKPFPQTIIERVNGDDSVFSPQEVYELPTGMRRLEIQSYCNRFYHAQENSVSVYVRRFR